MVRDHGQVPWDAGDQVEVLHGEYQGGRPQASNYPDYGPGMFDYQYSGLFTMNIDGDSGNQTSKWRRVAGVRDSTAKAYLLFGSVRSSRNANLRLSVR